MRKIIFAALFFSFSFAATAQGNKPYIDILLSQWRLVDTLNDTTLFHKDTLVLTRKYTYKVAHNASFLFEQGGVLKVYYACHTYPEETQEYCSVVFGQWAFVDPKNMNLFFTDMALYNSYTILSFSDEYMTLVLKK